MQDALARLDVELLGLVVIGARVEGSEYYISGRRSKIEEPRRRGAPHLRLPRLDQLVAPWRAGDRRPPSRRPRSARRAPTGGASAACRSRSCSTSRSRPMPPSSAAEPIPYVDQPRIALRIASSRVISDEREEGEEAEEALLGERPDVGAVRRDRARRARTAPGPPRRGAPPRARCPCAARRSGSCRSAGPERAREELRPAGEHERDRDADPGADQDREQGPRLPAARRGAASGRCSSTVSARGRGSATRRAENASTTPSVRIEHARDLERRAQADEARLQRLLEHDQDHRDEEGRVHVGVLEEPLDANAAVLGEHPDAVEEAVRAGEAEDVRDAIPAGPRRRPRRATRARRCASASRSRRRSQSHMLSIAR